MKSIKEGHTIISYSKPRNAFIAFLFSLILPGLAQVYNGQPRKALLFFSLLLLFPLLFGLTRGATFFYGYLALFAIEIILRIYIIVDGVKNARRQQDYIPKNYNTWYYHLFIAVAMITILWIYDMGSVLGIQSFNIPTISNQPTFQFGDKLVADMKAYRKAQPGYGDMVVFKRDDGQIYTFRIMGLPNDSLELNNNIVSINGRKSKATFIRDTIVDEFQVHEFEEELPNGHKHRIYKSVQPFDSTKTTIKNIVVPTNSYYLLGDNRDNAADSRYEGFVSTERIKGRMLFSYWGHSTDRINVDFRDK